MWSCITIASSVNNPLVSDQAYGYTHLVVQLGVAVPVTVMIGPPGLNESGVAATVAVMIGPPGLNEGVLSPTDVMIGPLGLDQSGFAANA